MSKNQVNSGSFKCVKISLIVLYVLSIISIVIFLAFAIIALALIESHNNGSTEPTTANGSYEFTIPPEEQAKVDKVAKTVFIAVIIGFAISLVFTIIGLIGVIKENKCIVITITVFSALGVVANFVQKQIASAIIGLAVTALTGIYAHMINQNQKANIAV